MLRDVLTAYARTPTLTPGQRTWLRAIAVKYQETVPLPPCRGTGQAEGP